MKHILIIALAIGAWGCDYKPTLFERQQDRVANMCISKGGIPIYSTWTGKVVDCKIICKEPTK